MSLQQQILVESKNRVETDEKGCDLVFSIVLKLKRDIAERLIHIGKHPKEGILEVHEALIGSGPACSGVFYLKLGKRGLKSTTTLVLP